MNKFNQLLKGILFTLLGALLAGSSTHLLLLTLKSPVNVPLLYLCALLAALVGTVASLSLIAAIVSAVAILLAGGASFIMNRAAAAEALAWARSLIVAMKTGEPPLQAGLLPVCAIAVLLGFLTALLLYRRGSSVIALMLHLFIILCCYATVPKLPLTIIIPGLIAMVVVFARGSSASADMIGGWRAIIPASLAVLLAMILVPSAGLTWEPLEDAAQLVRRVFQDYFNFTSERVPYTLYRDGYNHVDFVDDLAVIELGGPAEPSEENRIAVTTDSDLLLRGSIYRNYTGSGWEDRAAKRRYLYYDVVRRKSRRELFCTDRNDLFESASATIEFLQDGSSALFIPTRTNTIESGGELAVYYNSIGEVFFAREAREGDTYTVTGYKNADNATKRRAIAQYARVNDGNYKTMRRENLRLPAGIEEALYALTRSITENCVTDFDRVLAIENWLVENCTYTLEPALPDSSRDFVSEFVLDTKEGYCSYFASAMTVMCRIVGVPARYVEGYSVHGNQANTPVILTGKDAHAWTEVYFNGLGWLPFDPASGTDGYRALHRIEEETPVTNEGTADGAPIEFVDNASGEPSPAATPTPTPTPTPDIGGTAAGAHTPTPAPEGDNDAAAVTPTPESGESDPTPTPDNGESDSTPAPKDNESDPSPTPPPQDDSAASEATPTPSPTPRIRANAQNPEDESRDDHLKFILYAVAALVALILLILLWIAIRLRRTDALRLSTNSKDSEKSAMILYRGTLTLLRHMGQSPMNGETPSQFAERVGTLFANTEFADFTNGVIAITYGHKPLDEQLLRTGQQAYRKFYVAMKPVERRRFSRTRVLHGLGRIDVIP